MTGVRGAQAGGEGHGVQTELRRTASGRQADGPPCPGNRTLTGRTQMLRTPGWAGQSHLRKGGPAEAENWPLS